MVFFQLIALTLTSLSYPTINNVSLDDYFVNAPLTTIRNRVFENSDDNFYVSYSSSYTFSATFYTDVTIDAISQFDIEFEFYQNTDDRLLSRNKYVVEFYYSDSDGDCSVDLFLRAYQGTRGTPNQNFTYTLVDNHNLFVDDFVFEENGNTNYLPSIDYLNSLNAYEVEQFVTNEFDISFQLKTYNVHTMEELIGSDYDSAYQDGWTNGYNTGYNNGYTNGSNDTIDHWTNDLSPIIYEEGYNHGYDQGVYDGESSGYTNGYQQGHSDGYGEGLRDGEQISSGDYTFKKLFLSIADVPIYILRNLLGFDVFGIQAFKILIGMIGGLLALFIIRKFVL